MVCLLLTVCFPGGSDGKASVYNAGDLGSIPGLGRSPGEGSGTPLQNSCLENPTDGGAWWATVHGVAKSRTTTERPHFHSSILTLLHSSPLNTHHLSELGLGTAEECRKGSWLLTQGYRSVKVGKGHV